MMVVGWEERERGRREKQQRRASEQVSNVRSLCLSFLAGENKREDTHTHTTHIYARVEENERVKRRERIRETRRKKSKKKVFSVVNK